MSKAELDLRLYSQGQAHRTHLTARGGRGGRGRDAGENGHQQGPPGQRRGRGIFALLVWRMDGQMPQKAGREGTAGPQG